MKTYKLKIPLSPISKKGRKDNYFNWLWFVIDEVADLFAENIKKKLGFSYNDYFENQDDFDYAFWFIHDSIEYFVYLHHLRNNDEFIEFEIEFGTFEIKKGWLFNKRYESNKFYQKLEKTILDTIKQNNAEISKMKKLAK